MVTSEEINPFIKNAWPGSIYRLALPVPAPRFDLSAMEKLLANFKPCHVICFCKFVEIIHNPIMWPRGQSCIKNIQSLCYHEGVQLSYGKAEGFCRLSWMLWCFKGRGTFFSRFTKTCSDPSQGLFFCCKRGIIVTLPTPASALRGG